MARQTAVGSADTNVVTERSGSTHCPHSTTAITGTPSESEEARKLFTTFDTHGAPSLTTSSGRWLAAKISERRMPSAAAIRVGPGRRSPDRGSANTGQPKAAEAADTSSGSPQPAPATITPCAPVRPACTIWATTAGVGARGSTSTWYQGAPSGRPGSTLLTSPFRTSGSRKGRFTWTGPGPPGPETASATVREARERQVERLAGSATPGSTNQRTDRPKIIC